MFCRMEHDIPIIILSDDDDDDEGDFFTTHNDSSVMIVENEGNEAGSLLHTYLNMTLTKLKVIMVSIHSYHRPINDIYNTMYSFACAVVVMP